MRTNFVLVDLENVQPRNIGLLYGGPFKIKVFLGATQCKISLDMARAFQAFGRDVEYIQMDGNGTNALDFHIAYYVGRAGCRIS
ncbi:MAG: PIN domain-containing protein [Gammaproteobacteria bacterium]